MSVSVCFCPFLSMSLNFSLFLSVSVSFCPLQSKFMSQFVSNNNAFVLNMTGFVLNKTGLVLNLTEIVPNMKGFDYFFEHVGPSQPGLLV